MFRNVKELIMKTPTPNRPGQDPPKLDDPIFKENPFEVPEQYFETFAQRLDLTRNTGTPGKVIALPRRRTKILSVAAALLLLIGTSLLLWFSYTNRPAVPQFSDQVVVKQEPLKKQQPAKPADTTRRALKNTGGELPAPARTNTLNPSPVTDHSVEALQKDGITDDDIIEYLMEEGLDLIDLSYQP